MSVCIKITDLTSMDKNAFCNYSSRYAFPYEFLTPPRSTQKLEELS